MALPARITAFNRDHLNPLTLKAVGHAHLADLQHTGRATGTTRHTPVMAFHDKQRRQIVIALTYGPHVQWLKNIRAAHGCTLTLENTTYQLGAPRNITPDRALPVISQPQRTLLRWPIRCTHYIALPIQTEHPLHHTARLQQPTSDGWVLIAIATTRRGPIVNPSTREQRQARAKATNLAALLGQDRDVLETVRLEAVLSAPGTPRTPHHHGPLSWDHVVLARTVDAAHAHTVAERARAHAHTLGPAKHLITAATNVRRIADVPHPHSGCYLLNFFTGPDLQTTLDAWEHTAAWFQTHTGLNNSTVLEPTGQTPYTIINHCRWDRWTPVLLNLATRPSFRSHVLHTFQDAQVRPHPTLYRLSSHTEQARHLSRRPDAALAPGSSPQPAAGEDHDRSMTP